MGQIRVTKDLNGMSGLCLIEPALHGDSRGYFIETYNERDMEEAGISIRFVQDNQSMSTKGVLRRGIRRGCRPAQRFGDLRKMARRDPFGR